MKVNLRHLGEHGKRVEGELPIGELDLDLHDEMIVASQPLHYDLQVEKVAHGVLVQGKLDLTLDCRCVRCLKPFKKQIELPQWTLHMPLEGEEKVVVDNDCVDLTPFVREDMLLEFPQHPVCDPDCPGLNKKGRGQPETHEPAWNKLDRLKL